MRAPVITGVGVACALGVVVAIVFSRHVGGDYEYQVAPAMNALLAGDVSEFFRVQPVYGGFSTLARLPFAGLARLADGGELLVYRLGVLPSLAALGLLALYLAKLMRERGQALLAQVVVGVLILVNPVTIAAVERGHPEELLAAALAVGAVLAAIRGRCGWGGLALGLALGTKQWAVLAVLPVLIACEPGRRLRLALVAVAVAAALTVPMAVANPDRFVMNNRAAQGYSAGHVSRLSVWWPIASRERRPMGGGEDEQVTVYKLPAQLTSLARPLVVVVAIVLSYLFWRRRERLQREDTLALLALVLLLRSALDPIDTDYYHAPFLVALLAWESLRLRGLAVLAAVAAAGLWATLRSSFLSPLSLGDSFYAVNNVFYLAWVFLFAGLLGLVLFTRQLSMESPAACKASLVSRFHFTRSWIRAADSRLR